MAFSFSLNSVSQLWNRFWFEPETAARLKVYRFIIFCLATIYLFFVVPSEHPATFYEHWQPISFFKLLPGPIPLSVLTGIKIAWLLFSLMAARDFYFSITGKLAALFGVFFLGYSYNFGHVYHSYHLYIMMILILAFSREDKKNPVSFEHHWPLSLCFTYVVYVMFYCGLQKMYYGNGLNWALSESFYLRLLTNPYHPPLNETILSSPMWVSQAMAFWAVIIVEVLCPLFLFTRNSRWVLFWIWTSFHVVVMLAYGSHKHFVSQVFCYTIILPIGEYRKYLPKKLFSREAL